MSILSDNRGILNKHHPRSRMMLIATGGLSLMAIAAAVFILGRVGLQQTQLNFLSQQEIKAQGVLPSNKNLPTAAPTGISIPSLKLSAPIVPVALGPEKELQTPVQDDAVGWYIYSPSPGEVGPAILVGHLDSTTGPAIFWHLKNLTIGDKIVINRNDGTTATFTVSAKQIFPQDPFPTEQVYGATSAPTLRIITCAGKWLSSLHRYSDDLVIFANLSSTSK